MQLADWDAGVPKGPVFSLDFAPNLTLEDRHTPEMAGESKSHWVKVGKVGGHGGYWPMAGVETICGWSCLERGSMPQALLVPWAL